MSVNTLDIVLIAVITLFMIRCYVKGFASEVLSMAAIVLSVLAAVFFYKYGAVFVRAKFLPDAKALANVIAFVGIFLIVFLAVKVIEVMIKGIIDKIQISKLDRFLGFLFGLLEGITLACLILFILKVQPIVDTTELLEESFFARLILPLITVRENLTNV